MKKIKNKINLRCIFIALITKTKVIFPRQWDKPSILEKVCKANDLNLYIKADDEHFYFCNCFLVHDEEDEDFLYESVIFEIPIEEKYRNVEDYEKYRTEPFEKNKELIYRSPTMLEAAIKCCKNFKVELIDSKVDIEILY